MVTGDIIHYRCDGCGKAYVKLWRQCQKCNPKLECVDCVLRSQDREGSEVKDDGLATIKEGDQFYRSYAIGWMVPAIPTEDALNFWGYGAIPDAGLRWWRSLPLR